MAPPSAAGGTLHSEPAAVRPLGPALLWMAVTSALFTTALGDCGPPPALPYASLLVEPNTTEFVSGDVLRYRCLPGYTKTTSTQTLTCLDSGVWKYSKTCVKKRCQHPGELRNGQIIVHTDLEFGSRISFSCSEGYILIGPSTSFCDAQDQGVAWSDPLPLCTVAKCAPPPAISNGRYNGRNREFYTHGSSVTYSCDPPFTLIGDASISCSLENKTQTVWKPDPPTCKKVSCVYPEVRHGKVVSGFRSTFRYKDSPEINCDDGFRLVGSSVIRCEANGEWSPPPPVCEQTSCLGLPTILHADWVNSFQLSREKVFSAGTNLLFNCHPGYRASQPTTVICQENLTWSLPAHCEKLCCPKPLLKGGYITRQRKQSSDRTCDYFYRDTIQYSCQGKGNHESTCQMDGTWSTEPTCENKCYLPPDIAHGSHEKTSSFISRSYDVQYTCEPGYHLVGAKKLSCTEKGWSAPAPQCKVECPRPEIEHGYLSQNKSQYLESDSVTVLCDSGYKLAGNQTITCSEDKTWSPAVPRCMWEMPEGCESVAKGRKLMQCLPDPQEAKLAQEMYKLSLEIQLLEVRLEQARTNLLRVPDSDPAWHQDEPMQTSEI